jgi:hypothetical protein
VIICLFALHFSQRIVEKMAHADGLKAACSNQHVATFALPGIMDNINVLFRRKACQRAMKVFECCFMIVLTST